MEILGNKEYIADFDEELDEEIAELVDTIRENQEQIERREARIQFAKEELRELLEKRGSNWSDDEGYARLVSGGMRVSYDTKALDELIIKDPLRHGWLRDYRSESEVPPRIAVK